MGYRLEFTDPNNEDKVLNSCGGKLYGYIEDAELKECKSWQWMKDNGFFNLKGEYDEELAETWFYGSYHTMFLSKEQFRKFITLYIEDRNRFRFNDEKFKDSIEQYDDALQLNVIKCEWF